MVFPPFVDNFPVETLILQAWRRKLSTFPQSYPQNQGFCYVNFRGKDWAKNAKNDDFQADPKYFRSKLRSRMAVAMCSLPMQGDSSKSATVRATFNNRL